eukprot:5130265-Ditylum_brightwellii.AAC.1
MRMDWKWNFDEHSSPDVPEMPKEPPQQLSDWFPQVTDDLKDWERRRKLLTSNILGRKDRDEIFGE